MTCKNCIHYKACKSMCEAFGFTVDGDGEAASERCEQFEKVLENSEFADLVARLRLTDSRSKRALLDSAAYAIEYLQIQMNREHLAHLRLQDYDVSRAEDYRRMTIERNMLARKLREAESALRLINGKEKPKHWKMVWHKSHTNSQQSCKLKMVCPDCGAVLPYKQPVNFDFCPCCGKPKVYPSTGGMEAEVEEVSHDL